MAEKKILQAYALMSDGSMVQIDLPQRGRWELKKKTYKTGQTLAWFECSGCGLATLIKTPYCPECGAKMEEEE